MKFAGVTYAVERGASLAALADKCGHTSTAMVDKVYRERRRVRAIGVFSPTQRDTGTG